MATIRMRLSCKQVETLNLGNIAIQSEVVTNRVAEVERWATFHYFARSVLEQVRDVLE